MVTTRANDSSPTEPPARPSREGDGDDLYSGQTFELGPRRVLTTGEEIHSYPGKRILVRGTLDGRNVVAKFYLGRLRGWWEWRRGLRGTQALLEADIPAPALIHSGYIPAARAWLTLLDFITTDRPWPPSAQENQPAQFADAHHLLLAALARQHAAGIVQNDLNWTNFLPRGGNLYSIDGDRVHRRSAPLGRRDSLINLRRLYAYKADFGPADIIHGYTHYCQLRDWQPIADEHARLIDSIYRERLKASKRFVRRSLSGWKHFRRQRNDNRRLVVDRRRLSAATLDAILAGTKESLDAPAPDPALPTELDPVSGEECLETADGPFRLRAFPGSSGASSARTAWARAILLRRLRIPAEQAAALIEVGRIPWARPGWLVTRSRPHGPLDRALGNAAAPDTDRIIEQVGEILGRLWLAHLHLPTATKLHDFGLTADGEVLIRRPERVSEGRWPETAAPVPDLVQALVEHCAADPTKTGEALQRGIDRAVLRPPDEQSLEK